MFGIILGTLCLIALIRTIGRERYYRRHGYPQHPHGCYGYGHHHCGGYSHHHHGWHPSAPPPEAPPAQPPTEGATP